MSSLSEHQPKKYLPTSPMDPPETYDADYPLQPDPSEPSEPSNPAMDSFLAMTPRERSKYVNMAQHYGAGTARLREMKLAMTLQEILSELQPYAETNCSRCGGILGAWYDPLGDINWSHHEHPADEHDAMPMDYIIIDMSMARTEILRGILDRKDS